MQVEKERVRTLILRVNGQGLNTTSLVFTVASPMPLLNDSWAGTLGESSRRLGGKSFNLSVKI